MKRSKLRQEYVSFRVKSKKIGAVPDDTLEQRAEKENNVVVSDDTDLRRTARLDRSGTSESLKTCQMA